MTGTSSEYVEQDKPSNLEKLGKFIFGIFCGVVFVTATVLFWQQF